MNAISHATILRMEGEISDLHEQLSAANARIEDLHFQRDEARDQVAFLGGIHEEAVKEILKQRKTIADLARALGGLRPA